MRRIATRLIAFAAALTLVPLTAVAVQASPASPTAVTGPDIPLTQYVDPLIGSDFQGPTAAHGGITFPGATRPFGMVAWSPDTNYGHLASGYDYNDNTIEGFSPLHMSGAGCHVFQDIPFTPITGNITTSPGTNFSDYNSAFQHANEIATPGYYSVYLDDYAINAELTATTRTGVGRFTYPATTSARMLINVGQNNGNNYGESVQIVGTDTIQGHSTSGRFCGLDGLFSQNRYTVYFVAKFDRAFTSSGTWTGGTVSAGSASATGPKSGAYVTFNTTSNQVVNVKIGLSFVSTANALANLNAESPGWNFAGTKTAAEAAWNAQLNKVQVTGGTADQKEIFYTAMYHAFMHPNVFNDVNGQYAGFDGQIKTLSPGQTAQYANFSSWDTYRSQMQLVALLNPVEGGDMAQSLVNEAAARNGYYTEWSIANGESNIMGSDASTIIVANMAAFGADGFDKAAALAYMKKTASVAGVEGREGLQGYLDSGYIPKTDYPGVHVMFGGTSATTLEYASSDFAIARFALQQGDLAAYNRYMSRSQNWKNLWDPSVGYFRNKYGQTNFQSPFNAGVSEGFGEGDAAIYVWMVPHNTAALFEKMGGNATAISRLEAHLTTFDGLTDTHADMRNEPAHLTPYLYNAAGAPYKTQQIVRRIMTTVFNSTPNGLVGNDDLGATSAWYVWSALGIYPQIPGVGGFTIGSPLFPSAVVRLEGGHELTITGTNAAANAPYVQSLTLNGVTHAKTWLPYSSIAGGASLVFTLGTTANTGWATAASAAPPSYRFPVDTQRRYVLINRASGKALKVTGNGTANGTNVESFTNSASLGQLWDFTELGDGTYKLVNPNSARALSVSGTNVVVNTDTAAASQRWVVTDLLNGYYKLVNPNTGKALNVASGSTADGANVDVATDDGSTREQWQIVATDPPIVSGGTYILVNQNSGTALDVTASGTTDSTPTQGYFDNGSAAQEWRVISTGGGAYKLINTNSSRALDVRDSGTANGSVVQIYTDNNSAAQRWTLTPTGNGFYEVINVNSGKALDMSGSGVTDGTPVQIYTDNNSNAQRWRLVLKALPVTVANAGFETPVLTSAPYYVYNPAPSGWTFAGGTGVQRNGGAFIAATAPEGAQTGFTWSIGTMSQSITTPAAGFYRLDFQAAKRSIGLAQVTDVFIDGVKVASVAPTSLDFKVFRSNVVALTAGAHTLSFSGTVSGDATNFIDDVRLLHYQQ